MTDRARPRHRATSPTQTNRRRHGALALAALLLGAGAAAADTPPSATAAPPPYLADTVDKLPFKLDPPPAINPDIERNQVLSAQLGADSVAREEAFADAAAYLPDDLIKRFSAAAGEPLDRYRRPILAHMLFRLWRNVDGYTGALKGLNKRDRPFVKDSTIQPCNVSFLQTSNGASYPSGHAAEGYAAALLLVDIMRGNGAPDERDRTDLLLARGVRFGTNRIVCGVHFPSDVATGQAFAKMLYQVVAASPEFGPDLACARVEELADRRNDLKKRLGYPAACVAMADAYAKEDHFN